MKLNPMFKPPADFVKTKPHRKLYIPTDEYPGYNFIGKFTTIRQQLVSVVAAGLGDILLLFPLLLFMYIFSPSQMCDSLQEIPPASRSSISALTPL